MAQAACAWAPPTAEQPGLIGTNWSKGWIIENNHIHDAKCSGISLGKERATGHNEATVLKRKPGYQYQLEIVCRAWDMGWNKEKIGSHIVRNNVIHSCGQNGIVGHMGCAFSEIYGNHIFDIAVKHEFFGYEIAGIKLHAAVDTRIHHNRIDHCTLGVWLDWQAQGTRVSKNVFYENNRDFFIEVTHGPCVVDNNIFGSRYNMDNAAQGTAFLHNLWCGGIRHIDVLNRSTPYHFAHSTKLMGFAYVYGGDDRWFHNLFIGKGELGFLSHGTTTYDGHPVSYEEFIDRITNCDIGNDHDKYLSVGQAVYLAHNVYCGANQSFDRETNPTQSMSEVSYRFVEEGAAVYLEMAADETMLQAQTTLVETALLGTTRISEGCYEDHNGRDVVFDTDLLDQVRDVAKAGPLHHLQAGKNRIKIW